VCNVLRKLLLFPDLFGTLAKQSFELTERVRVWERVHVERVFFRDLVLRFCARMRKLKRMAEDPWHGSFSPGCLTLGRPTSPPPPTTFRNILCFIPVTPATFTSPQFQPSNFCQNKKLFESRNTQMENSKVETKKTLLYIHN
jgi:hypothetical protein